MTKATKGIYHALHDAADAVIKAYNNEVGVEQAIKGLAMALVSCHNCGAPKIGKDGKMASCDCIPTQFKGNRELR